MIYILEKKYNVIFFSRNFFYLYMFSGRQNIIDKALSQCFVLRAKTIVYEPRTQTLRVRLLFAFEQRFCENLQLEMLLILFTQRHSVTSSLPSLIYYTQMLRRLRTHVHRIKLMPKKKKKKYKLCMKNT